jgi:hypothetical protein
MVFKDDAMCIATWHNVSIQDYAGLMRVTHAREIRRCYQAILAQHPTAFGLVCLRAGVPLADAEARAESSKMLKELGRRVAKSVIVIEEQGTQAAVLRAVTRGINVLTGNVNIFVAASVADGARLLWPLVRTRAGESVTEAELLAEVKRVRESFAPLAPAVALGGR